MLSKKRILFLITLGILIEALIAINFLFFPQYPYSPLALWVAFMFALIAYCIRTKRNYSLAPRITELLTDTEHAQTARDMSEGYHIFYTEMHPRGLHKSTERIKYDESFKQFAQLTFEKDSELYKLQKKVRRASTYAHLLVTFFITWFVMFPIAIVIVIVSLKH